MSWPAGAAPGAWPVVAGGVPSAMMGGQDMNMAMMSQCTPEQWAAMQQQNWQQWSQWQQQYAQWQSQYGDKYAAQMQSMQTFGGNAPPLPAAPPSQPAPPPPDKPPPPPYENNQPLYQSSKAGPASFTSGAAAVPNAITQSKDNSRPPARAPNSWDSSRPDWISTQQGEWNTASMPANAGSFDRHQQKPWVESSYDSNRGSTEGVNSEALKKHAEEERLFDIQFQKWEEEFEKWKKENVNHPDKRAYADYEQKFETCRAQLMERRQQMKQKRLKLMSGNIQPPIKDASINKSVEEQTPHPVPTPVQNQPQSKNFNRYGQEDMKYFQEKNQQPQSNNPYPQNEFSQDKFSQSSHQYSQNKGQYPQDKNEYPGKNQFAQDNNQYTRGNNNYPPGNARYAQDKSAYDCYEQEPMENSNDSYSNSNFLSSSEQRKGIPGLDLVDDEDGKGAPARDNSDVIDITEDPPQKNDFSAALSKGINNILGDEKILNILSMVQGQKLQPGNMNANQGPIGNTPFQGNHSNNFGRGDNLNSNTSSQNSGPNSWLNQNQNQNREGLMNQPKDDYHNQNPADKFNNMPPGLNPRQNNMVRNQPPPGRINDLSMQRSNEFTHGQNYNSSAPPPPMGRGDMPSVLNVRGQDFQNNSYHGHPNSGMNPNMRQNMGHPNRLLNQDMGPPNRGNDGMGPPNRGMNDGMGPPNRGMNDGMGPPNRGMNDGMGPLNRGINQDMGLPNRGMNQEMGFANRGMSPIGHQNRGIHQDMGLQNRGMNQDTSLQNKGLNPDMGVSNRGLNMGTNRTINPDLGLPNRGLTQGMEPQNIGMNQGMGPRRNIPDMGVQRPDMFMTQEHGRGHGSSMGTEAGVGHGVGVNEGMGMNRGPNAIMPSIPPVQPVDKWEQEPVMEPSIIVDYDHKPVRMKVRNFIEPVQTFDYNHKSNEKDSRNENKPSDRWSELDVYNERSGTKVIDYQNKSLGGHPPIEADRRPNRRFDRDADRREEPMERRERERLPDRNHERPGDRRRDDRGDDRRRDDRPDDRRRDDRPDERRRDDRMRYERHRSRERASPDRGRDRSRDRPDWNRDRGRDRDSRKRDRSKEKTQPAVESIKSAHNKPNEKSSSPSTGTKHLVMIDDLLELPGRDVRPDKLVIILRGIPGSGKSYLAKLIKEREVENGGSAPRILSIDDYFIQETEVEEEDSTGKMVKKQGMKYVYDEKSEEDYLNCLKRAYRRTLTDQFFPFIIVDAVNDQLKSFAEFWNFGRQNGFQVYVCAMECDPQTAFKRNIHNRSLEDIQVIAARFLDTPNHFISLDATTLLQSAAIQDVHMEDVNSDDDVIIMEDAMEEPEPQSTEHATSKWEKMDDSSQLARLDGTSKPLRPSQYSLDEYLQLDDWQPARTAQPGKKTVRWADIEERREQEKMRAIGFVVGQTDWHRMTDPTLGSSALTQMKYIERTRRN